MNPTRLLAQSFRTLPRYRLRTAFMMLGSFVGAAALTLVISVGAGAKRKTMNTVRQLFGASSILVMGSGTEFMGGPRPDAARFTLDDVEAVAKQVPQIEAWDPQQAMPAASIRHGDATTKARVLGASERFQHVWDRGVVRGETFDLSAVNGSARVALIGQSAARAVFGTEDPLGAEILIGQVSFKIIGVLEVFGTDLHGMDRDNEIVVPITTLQRRLMNVDTIAAAKLLVRDQSQVAAASKEVQRVLRDRHAIPTGRPDDFRMITAVAVQQMVAKAGRVLDIYLPLVALVALAVGGMVAAALMLVSVNQRIGEIGLRRAVGARAEDIGRQFLIETAVTALGGGILGIAVGSAAALLVARKMQLGPIFSWEAVLIALIASAITGLLSGVLPARRAARLLPADSLR